jgi:hypothetical protein
MPLMQASAFAPSMFIEQEPQIPRGRSGGRRARVDLVLDLDERVQIIGPQLSRSTK